MNKNRTAAPVQETKPHGFSGAEPRSTWAPPDWLLALAIVAVVACLYLPRLTELTVRGEESGWARVGMEMEESGDWVVPKLQGTVYAERPPLGSWLMMAVGQWTGDNLLAIRLPSVLATALAGLAIFFYARTFLGPVGAFAAGLAYPTMGQVLQLGRLGESEAVFSFLLASGLFIWHIGYLRGWPRWAIWMAGYTLIALAAMTKGIQAPLYFGAATGAYLLFRKEWRTLFGWEHFAALAWMLALVGVWSWLVYERAGAETLLNTWTGLVRDRLGSHGVQRRILGYPLETLACTAPWSVLLALALIPRFRPLLSGGGQHFRFLVTALVVTYPTVWLASNSRGRYYMPMYPLIAVLAGLACERWAGSVGDALLGAWRQRTAWLAAVAIAVASVLVAGISWTTLDLPPWLEPVQLTPAGSAIVLMAGLAAAACLLTTACRTESYAPYHALLGCAAMMGCIYSGAVVDMFIRHSRDIATPVAELKAKLGDKPLASLGPVRHRFSWYYGPTITMHAWPKTADELPPDVEYFCFDRYPEDTPERRRIGRGREFEYTHGTLPFEWEQVARLEMESSRANGAAVIVGRVKRDVDPRTTRAGKTDRR